MGNKYAKGRPIKFTKELKQQIIERYDNAPKGQARKDLAAELGIKWKSLLAYICAWKRQEKGADPYNAIFGANYEEVQQDVQAALADNS